MAEASSRFSARQLTAEAMIDDQGRVAEDLRCLKCDYNLRMTAAEGRCPECGLAVMRSAVGHWLRYCEPGWLKQIWEGLNGLAVLIVGLGAYMALLWSGWMDRAGPDWWVVLLPGLSIAIGLGLGIWGVWRAATPDPAALEVRVYTLRFWLRVLLLVTPLTLLAGPLMPWALGLGSMVFLALFFLYFSSLARRVPHRPLVWLTGISGLLLVSGYGAQLLLLGDPFEWQDRLFPWIGPQGLQWYAEFYDYYEDLHRTAWQLGWMMLGVVLLLPILFIWYWGVFTREARFARATWAGRGTDASVASKKT